MAAKSGPLRIIDFGSSLFWTLAGVVSVGCTITAINQRIRVQEEQLRLMQDRNAVAEELTRLQDESRELRGTLELLEQQLQGAEGWRWRPVWEQLASTLVAAERGGGARSSRGGSGSSGSNTSSSSTSSSSGT